MQLHICDQERVRKVTIQGRMTFDQHRQICGLFRTLEDTLADEICIDLTELDSIDALGADALKSVEMECRKQAIELKFVTPAAGIVARYLSWWRIG